MKKKVKSFFRNRNLKNRKSYFLILIVVFVMILLLAAFFILSINNFEIFKSINAKVIQGITGKAICTPRCSGQACGVDDGCGTGTTCQPGSGCIIYYPPNLCTGVSCNSLGRDGKICYPGSGCTSGGGGCTSGQTRQCTNNINGNICSGTEDCVNGAWAGCNCNNICDPSCKLPGGAIKECGDDGCNPFNEKDCGTCSDEKYCKEFHCACKLGCDKKNTGKKVCGNDGIYLCSKNPDETKECGVLTKVSDCKWGCEFNSKNAPVCKKCYSDCSVKGKTICPTFSIYPTFPFNTDNLQDTFRFSICEEVEKGCLKWSKFESCSSGQACKKSSNKCEACASLTKEQLAKYPYNYNCGKVADGCGCYADLGNCPAGQFCSPYSGHENKCEDYCYASCSDCIGSSCGTCGCPKGKFCLPPGISGITSARAFCSDCQPKTPDFECGKDVDMGCGIKQTKYCPPGQECIEGKCSGIPCKEKCKDCEYCDTLTGECRLITYNCNEPFTKNNPKVCRAAGLRVPATYCDGIHSDCPPRTCADFPNQWGKFDDGNGKTITCKCPSGSTPITIDELGGVCCKNDECVMGDCGTEKDICSKYSCKYNCNEEAGEVCVKGKCCTGETSSGLSELSPLQSLFSIKFLSDLVPISRPSKCKTKECTTSTKPGEYQRECDQCEYCYIEPKSPLIKYDIFFLSQLSCGPCQTWLNSAPSIRDLVNSYSDVAVWHEIELDTDKGQQDAARYKQTYPDLIYQEIGTPTVAIGENSKIIKNLKERSQANYNTLKNILDNAREANKANSNKDSKGKCVPVSDKDNIKCKIDQDQEEGVCINGVCNKKPSDAMTCKNFIDSVLLKDFRYKDKIKTDDNPKGLDVCGPWIVKEKGKPDISVNCPSCPNPDCQKCQITGDYHGLCVPKGPATSCKKCNSPSIPDSTCYNDIIKKCGDSKNLNNDLRYTCDLITKNTCKTNNFNVQGHSTISSQPWDCCYFARILEYNRCKLAVESIGNPLDHNWPQRCVTKIVIEASQTQDSSTKTNNENGDYGKIIGITMELYGSREYLINDVIPHEVQHTINTDYIQKPINMWADEGIAQNTQSQSGRCKIFKSLFNIFKQERTIPFNDLIPMMRYPRDRYPLFDQGFSVVEFLIKKGGGGCEGKRKFLEFAKKGAGLTDWTVLIEKYYGKYGIHNQGDLQTQWQYYVAGQLGGAVNGVYSLENARINGCNPCNYNEDSSSTSTPENPVQPLCKSPVSPTTTNEQTATAATVRYKVDDGVKINTGSGTIIDYKNGKALVLTCGHTFRDSQGSGQISADTFSPERTGIPGKLITWSVDNSNPDLAFFSIPVDFIPTSIPIAPSTYSLTNGQEVLTSGCDHGNDCSIKKETITQLNRFSGPNDIITNCPPASGRSGGGLFTKDGYVIGVCSGGTEFGLYLSLKPIQDAYNKIKDNWWNYFILVLVR